MSDLKTRTAERQAATGDPRAAVRVLRERVRRNDQELAEEDMDYCPHCGRFMELAEMRHIEALSLEHFLARLFRWPGAELVAALAAGWAWWKHWTPTMGGILDEVQKVTPRRLLEAASDHVRCGCAGSQEAWRKATPAFVPGWVPIVYEPNLAACVLAAVGWGAGGEARTRDVVSAALIAWALEGKVCQPSTQQP